MEKLENLIKIASYLGLNSRVNELEQIKKRSTQENANLILPLVGEFSSGKTTLINALTDSKKLETATKPTTATIYEVHFGCNSCKADVLTEEGESVSVDDLSLLKNESLANAKVVTVFDTSKKISSNTILVDTPGLSSPDPKHKQTLVEFLPQADGILLVTDINQQITRSLTDFIETMKLSGRPIFLILTKSDTKSEKEIETAKQYISKNCQIPIEQVAVVSSMTGKLDELYNLLNIVNNKKKEILLQVDNHRTKTIAESLLTHVQELLKSAGSDKDIENSVRQSEHELDKIKTNIERLIKSVSDEISDSEKTIVRKFEDILNSKLNTLINGKSSNYDKEAISIINTTSSLLMNEYKNSVKSILCAKARTKEIEVPLNSLESIDLSSLKMLGPSYNLDLNNMGHEYDGWIKTGVIAVATVAAVGAVATTGGAATGVAGKKTTETIGTALTAETVIDIADTVSDVGSIVSNRKIAKRIEDAASLANRTYQNIEKSNQQVGQQMGCNKGLIDSLVGFVTERTMSKPQRSRAIRSYIDSSLVPEFKIGLNSISQQVKTDIRSNIYTNATELIEEKKNLLNQLKEEMNKKTELYHQRIEQLKQYNDELLTY